MNEGEKKMNLASYRDTWTEISLDAIRHNIKGFRKHVQLPTRLMAVVKADGYGHGAEMIAKTALQAGADYLGVALVDEALHLRRCQINAPILVLGYTSPSVVEQAVEHDITLTFYDEEALYAINKAATKYNKTANVHLKVDSGMGRIGVTTKETALQLAELTNTLSHVKLEGIFTHFASADTDDPSYTEMQFATFQETIGYLEENKIDIPIKHCCNSAATMQYPHMHLDMTRVGISLYGLLPDPDIPTRPFELKQAMHFKTKVAAVKTLPKGHSISYGCTYTTNDERKIATIPVGYADGLSRLLSNQAVMLVNEKRVPIVGRICMDQTMLDITEAGEVKVGDVVTIFGQDGSEFLSIDENAQIMGTINYEVVCGIGKRVPRIYIENNKVIQKQNLFFHQK
ncbi:alanine racemase [Bacillus tianshenii]|nr:alanine racemase [Bacillus tianshenii]